MPVKMNASSHTYYNSTRPIFYKSIGNNTIEVNNREVQGYLASFNTRDLVGDVFVEGAFKKSIAERGPKSNAQRKIAYLYEHDLKSPVGVFTDLWEDSKGLAFKGILDETDIGERLAIQYKSGSVNNHSVGYKNIWDKVEVSTSVNGEETFYIKEVILFEGSATPLGVNENTPYTGKKSSEIFTDTELLNNETEIFLKSLTPENEYIARQLIMKHIALTEIKPPAALKQNDEPQFDLNKAIKEVKIIIN